MSLTTESVLAGFSGGRDQLIPILQAVQEAEGYLSEESVTKIARKLRISESEVHGVASFYAWFRFNRPGRHNIKVCNGTACHVTGAQNFLDVMKVELDLDPGETSEDGEFSLERVACLGCCALAPAVVVGDEVHGRQTRSSFTALVHDLQEIKDN